MKQEELRDILAWAVDRTDAVFLALSGGLDSTILGYHMAGRAEAVSVIAQDFVASDLTYCQMASKRLGMPLEVRAVSIEQILDAVRQTVGILGNYNDIEIRNSVVIYLAMQHLREKGAKSLVTGDGADELFAGYGFMTKPGADTGAERARMRKIMHFPSMDIGRELGIRVQAPFLDDAVVEFAAGLPDSLLVGEYNGKRYGKLLLREAYQGRIPENIAWRDKAAMQDGAGTSGLTGLFESVIPGEAFEKGRNEVLQADGIRIRSSESLHYYRIYRDIFGRPPEDSENGCPYCRCRVEPGSKFCRMCGAFPV